MTTWSKSIAAFLLALCSLCWAQDETFSDSFEHEACAMTAVRQNLAISITPPAGGSDLKLRPAISLPVRKGVPIFGALVAQGGVPPYAFAEDTSVWSGIGITINPDGTLSGSPTSTGHFVATAKVEDNALGVFRCTLAIQVHANLQVVAADPPPGENGTVYGGYQYVVSGATGSLTWTDNDFGWPAGLSIDSSTGELTGAVSSLTSTPGTITVTDSGSGDSIVIPYHFEVVDALVIGFTYLATNPVSGSFLLPPIYVGTPWSTGTFIPDSVPRIGLPPFTLSVESLPTIPGLSIDSNNGEISVTVTDPALALGYTSPYAIGVTITDALGFTSVSTAYVPILLSQHVIETQSAGVSTGKFGTPVYDFSDAFTVADDGAKVSIDLVGGRGGYTKANHAINATIASSSKNRITAAGVALTTPASPADFDDFLITIEDRSFTGCTLVANSGQTVYGGLSTLNITIVPCAIWFQFNDDTSDWIMTSANYGSGVDGHDS